MDVSSLSEGAKTHETTVSASASASIFTEVRGKHFGLPEPDRPLPVVELKPFTRQVWRREKSLPEYYNKTWEEGEEEGERKILFEAGSNGEIVSKKDAALAAALVYKYLDNGVRKYSPETRLSEGGCSRCRFRPHPSVDFSYNYRKRSNALIPEFIPRVQRNKYTLKEADHDDNPNREYSCNKQHMSDRMTSRQQAMKLHGGTIHNSSGVYRAQLNYLNPIENYGQSVPWMSAGQREDGTRSLSPIRTFKTPNGDGGNIARAHRKTPTANSGCPSFSASRDKWNGKFVNPENISLSQKNNISVTIGGIKNALKLLSEMGPPTSVERQLTFEMEVNMERCRRHFELPATEGLTSVQQTNNSNIFHDVNRAVTLTRGETMLKQGRELNRIDLKSRKQSRGKKVPMGDFDRNIRHVEAAQMDTGVSSPCMDVIDSAFNNGLFDTPPTSPARGVSLSSRNYPCPGRRSDDSLSRAGRSNNSPSRNPTPVESNARNVVDIDIPLGVTKGSAQVSPRAASYTSGGSPMLGTYITEAGVGGHVISLDSCVLGERRTVETQTLANSSFRSYSNTKSTDGAVTADDAPRAVT